MAPRAGSYFFPKGENRLSRRQRYASPVEVTGAPIAMTNLIQKFQEMCSCTQYFGSKLRQDFLRESQLHRFLPFDGKRCIDSNLE